MCKIVPREWKQRKGNESLCFVYVYWWHQGYHFLPTTYFGENLPTCFTRKNSKKCNRTLGSISHSHGFQDGSFVQGETQWWCLSLCTVCSYADTVIDRNVSPDAILWNRSIAWCTTSMWKWSPTAFLSPTFQIGDKEKQMKRWRICGPMCFSDRFKTFLGACQCMTRPFYACLRSTFTGSILVFARVIQTCGLWTTDRTI